MSFFNRGPWKQVTPVYTHALKSRLTVEEFTRLTQILVRLQSFRQKIFQSREADDGFALIALSTFLSGIGNVLASTGFNNDAEFVLRLSTGKLAPGNGKAAMTGPSLASLVLVLVSMGKNEEAELLAVDALARLESLNDGLQTMQAELETLGWHNPQGSVSLEYSVERVASRRYRASHYRSIMPDAHYNLFESFLIEWVAISMNKPVSRVTRTDLETQVLLFEPTVPIVKVILTNARQWMSSGHPENAIVAYQTILCVEKYNLEAYFCLAILFRDSFSENLSWDNLVQAKKYATEYISLSNHQKQMFSEKSNTLSADELKTFENLQQNQDFMNEILNIVTPL
jgi:hypothetical protein